MSRPDPAGRSPVRRRSREGRSEVEQKRSAAKLGMTLSLGGLVATGFMKGGRARTLHLLSGVALIGFSFWHHNLYRSATRENEA